MSYQDQSIPTPLGIEMYQVTQHWCLNLLQKERKREGKIFVSKIKSLEPTPHKSILTKFQLFQTLQVSHFWWNNSNQNFASNLLTKVGIFAFTNKTHHVYQWRFKLDLCWQPKSYTDSLMSIFLGFLSYQIQEENHPLGCFQLQGQHMSCSIKDSVWVVETLQL